jgi:hypothetical protein
MDHGKQSIQYWNLSICTWVVVHYKTTSLGASNKCLLFPTIFLLKKFPWEILGNFVSNVNSTKFAKFLQEI